jgi:hypothetical protein
VSFERGRIEGSGRAQRASNARLHAFLVENWPMRATRQPQRPCAKPNQTVEMIRTRWPRVLETVIESTSVPYNPGVVPARPACNTNSACEMCRLRFRVFSSWFLSVPNDGGRNFLSKLCVVPTQVSRLTKYDLRRDAREGLTCHDCTDLIFVQVICVGMCGL